MEAVFRIQRESARPFLHPSHTVVFAPTFSPIPRCCPTDNRKTKFFNPEQFSRVFVIMKLI